VTAGSDCDVPDSFFRGSTAKSTSPEDVSYGAMTGVGGVSLLDFWNEPQPGRPTASVVAIVSAPSLFTMLEGRICDKPCDGANVFDLSVSRRFMASMPPFGVLPL
jgi:hypothetical protein